MSLASLAAVAPLSRRSTRRPGLAAAIAAAAMTVAAPSALAQSGDEPVVAPAAAPTVLYSSGLWKKDANSVTGVYRIVAAPDGSRTIVLGRDFRTKAAPDLKIVLSPRASGTVTSRNVLSNGRVISPLSSNQGAQSFPIPAELDLADYRSIAIHCEQYTKLWAAAPLHRGEVIAAAPEFQKKHKRTKGGYEIVRLDGRTLLRLSDDFSAPKAPEPLRILLSPLAAKDAKNRNAENGAVLIGTISTWKGGQTIPLPDGLDLESGRFKSLLLNCQKYTKLWSAAPLT